MSTKGCGISFVMSIGIGDTKTSLFLDMVTAGLVCSALLLRLFFGCLGVFVVVVVVTDDAASVLFLRSKDGCPLGVPPLGQGN